MNSLEIVYSRNVVEFVTVANEFCQSVEQVARISAEANLQKMQKLVGIKLLIWAMQLAKYFMAGQ